MSVFRERTRSKVAAGGRWRIRLECPGSARITAWGPLLGALILWGCAGTPVPPAYTQAELAERCVRTGGWWRGERPDSLYSSHCEYRD